MTDYFCDFSAGSNGSGTYASPFNTLSSAVSAPTVTSADTIWIRRGGTLTLADSASVHTNYNVAKIVGWPTSTGDDYATRPSVAQAVWDADPATKPNIKKNITTAANVGTFDMQVAGVQLRISNVKLESIQGGSVAGDIRRGIFMYMNSGSNTYLYLTNVDIVKTTDTLSGAGGCHSVIYSETTAPPYLYITGCTILMNGAATPDYGFRVCFWFGGITGIGDYMGGATKINFSNTALTTTFSYTNIWAYSPGAPLADYQTWLGTFIACTFTWTTAAKAFPLYVRNYFPWDSAQSGKLLVKDCKFVTVSGGAGINNNLYIQDGTTLNQGFRVENISAINFYTVKSEVLYDAPSYGVINCNDFSVYGSYVSISSLNAVTLNLNFGTDTLGRSYGSTPIAIIRNINSSCTINRFDGVNLMLSGIDGDPTTYKKINGYGTVSLAAPYRTGGEAFSVKMQATSYQKYGPQVTSHVRGLDTIFAAAASGARTVTIFGCYKNYSTQTPDTETVAAEIDAYTSTGQQILTSRQYLPTPPALTADASTWNGITGYTGFKIVFTFTSGADQNIAVRLLTSLSEAGELYFDPKPVVT